MSNMFQNTMQNMQDCIHAMHNASNISDMNLSDDEYEAFQEMTSLIVWFRIEADRLLVDDV